jgi:hypothetical protein
MSRVNRIFVSILMVTASVGLVLTLVMLGSATAGPFRASLDSLGALFSRAESSAVLRIRGPGRSTDLEFLSALRTNADSLRHPGLFLVGAYDADLPGSLEGVLRIEETLGQPLALIHVYTAWGDRRDQEFPARIVRAIREIGSIPVVTWEPWLSDFENRLHPHLPLRTDRDRGGLAAIAEGVYDFYIDAWAREAAEFGTPILLRFAHEMNDPYRYPWGPQNNDPHEFVAAWHHVVDRFRAAGAENVVWVWSPHVAYEGYPWYYPGESYVDWVATGVLNYGTVAPWSDWWSFDEIFGRHYQELAAYGKPIMLAEFGSLAVGGDRAVWFRDALRDMPERLPDVRALLYFHVSSDQTVTYQALDWSFVHDPATAQGIREAHASW